MSKTYDNWERLVAAVLKREEILQLCHQPSRSPSICSKSSDFSSSSRLSDVGLRKKEESVQRPFPKHVILGPSNPGFLLTHNYMVLQWLGEGKLGDSFLIQLLVDVRVSENEYLAKGTELVMKKLLNEVRVTEEEFKQQMMVFGNCRHENVAAPRAYYFSDKPNRKCIFYNYHSQDSVSDMLRGNRSRLNWESRLRIAIGAARGIAHIHTQCGGKLAHGNIKSSNIFLNSEQYGCVSDFSWAGIMEKPPQRRGQWYHAPAYCGSVSQEMDVYDFGNLLLELLTGESALEVQGFDIDLGLDTWIRSIEPHIWTSKLFDQSLRRIITDEKDLVGIVQTDIPVGHLVVKDSATYLDASKPVLYSHFHSVAHVSNSYFPTKDLMEMVEMLHVAQRCLAVFPSNKRHRTTMSVVVLMLENMTSSSDGKPQHAQNYNHPDGKVRVWNRIFRWGIR